jgi:hypothetical protein
MLTALNDVLDPPRAAVVTTVVPMPDARGESRPMLLLPEVQVALHFSPLPLPVGRQWIGAMEGGDIGTFWVTAMVIPERSFDSLDHHRLLKECLVRYPFG